jgi:hypothetical protein
VNVAFHTLLLDDWFHTELDLRHWTTTNHIVAKATHCQDNHSTQFSSSDKTTPPLQITPRRRRYPVQNTDRVKANL